MHVSRSKPATFFPNLRIANQNSGAAAGTPVLAGLSPEARFRYTLEQRGGLYSAFGQFLGWRADLLPGEVTRLLAGVRSRAGMVSRAELARRLESAFGSRGAKLAQGLEAEPCWNTAARCAYRASLEGRKLVVQLARDPVPSREFADFERGLPRLEEQVPRLRRVAAPEVFAQFRQWHALADAPGRERSYLEVLSGARDKLSAEYPAILPEFSNDHLLCSEWIDGQPLSALLSPGSGEVLAKLAECVLEQFCILSVVDGDLDPDAMVLTPGGRLGVRRASRLIAIPPALIRSSLKYISAALAGDTALSAQLLVKLATGSPSRALESRLLGAMSGLEPELKVDLRFPHSATVFENNWRALSRAGIPRPLFLDCLHRNLVALGYWEAEATSRGVPSRDAIGQAQWSVLGRLLRARIADLARRDAAVEWFAGSALLLVDGMRQMSRLAEEFRDNDILIGVEADEAAPRGDDTRNQAVRSGILCGLLLVVFLMCLRWGVASAPPLSTALAVIAVLAGAGLFWIVSRIG